MLPSLQNILLKKFGFGLFFEIVSSLLEISFSYFPFLFWLFSSSFLSGTSLKYGESTTSISALKANDLPLSFDSNRSSYSSSFDSAIFACDVSYLSLNLLLQSAVSTVYSFYRFFCNLFLKKLSWRLSLLSAWAGDFGPKNASEHADRSFGFIVPLRNDILLLIDILPGTFLIWVSYFFKLS